METSHGAFYSPSQVARLLLLFFPVSLTCLTNQSRTFLALASTLEIKFRINVGDPALEVICFKLFFPSSSRTVVFFNDRP